MRAPAPRPSNANRSSCVQSILQRGGTCGPPTDLLSHGRFSRCGAAGPTAAAPKRLKAAEKLVTTSRVSTPKKGLRPRSEGARSSVRARSRAWLTSLREIASLRRLEPTGDVFPLTVSEGLVEPGLVVADGDRRLVEAALDVRRPHHDGPGEVLQPCTDRRRRDLLRRDRVQDLDDRHQLGPGDRREYVLLVDFAEAVLG